MKGGNTKRFNLRIICPSCEKKITHVFRYLKHFPIRERIRVKGFFCLSPLLFHSPYSRLNMFKNAFQEYSVYNSEWLKFPHCHVSFSQIIPLYIALHFKILRFPPCASNTIFNFPFSLS